MDQDHPRSPLALGMEWASRITTLGVEFSLPAIAGHFADRRLETGPAFLMVGMVLGFTLGIFHLVKIAHASSRGR